MHMYIGIAMSMRIIGIIMRKALRRICVLPSSIDQVIGIIDPKTMVVNTL